VIEIRTVGAPGRGSRVISPPRDRSIVALSVNMAAGVLEGSIHFGSLEFIINNTDGLRYVPSFNLDQAIRFGSLQFVADKLGHLHLRGARDEAHAVPISSAEGYTIAEGGTLTVDLDALARRIDTHLEPEPELEECWRTFHVLTKVLSKLAGDEPMPQKS
jgi:hypothetical protein